MRGRVLAYDRATGEGAIGGYDGNRYTVIKGGLGTGVEMLQPGRVVDYVAVGNAATSVFPFDEKNQLVAAWFAILFGAFGIHKFYLGKNAAGVFTLVVFLFSLVTYLEFCLPFVVIGLIEGVRYLTRSRQEFIDAYVVGGRSWF